YEEDRRALEMRFAYIRRGIEGELCERKLRLALELGRDGVSDRFAELEAEAGRKIAGLEEAWSFISKANEPTLLEEGGFERLVEIAQLEYLSPSGELRPYLETGEVAALQIARGSLTAVERVEIESHVVHTYNFLKKIPWQRDMADLPRIAGAHHEYLNGIGYPRRLRGGDIPIESRMMTIADIYDALTASDRPYKKAVPIDRALGIIEGEVKAGKCDPDLFRLFVEAEVYRKVL
ncbi:MAG TPA: HD domain-containing phosphohydrolase, partial [Polyangia bacterium]|nr:HD domain-containing phosphohydrolase [Polyangia bacterium]